jgi:hypothetical protein
MLSPVVVHKPAAFAFERSLSCLKRADPRPTDWTKIALPLPALDRLHMGGPPNIHIAMAFKSRRQFIVMNKLDFAVADDQLVYWH